MSFSNKLGIHILLFLIATFIACTDNDIQENNNNLPPKDEPTPPQEEDEEHLFDILNLDYPGLEEIKSLYKSGENDAAMQKLLTYYRSRTDIENPNLTATLNDTEQGYADYAIDEYRFYVNDNYLEDKDRKIPYSLKSNDQTINWQFAPEGADNEYQKQLHRHNWIPMQGKAYQKSKNEKICFHGKKYIQIGYSKIQSRMGNRTNSNGTSSKCPHVLWGKQNLSSISNPPLISLRNGFPFSSYILLNMPIIYPCTNIPEKTIFY